MSTALPPPVKGLKVSWTHDAVEVSLRSPPVRVLTPTLVFEVALVAAAWITAFTVAAPHHHVATWLSAAPASVLGAVGHRLWASRCLVLRGDAGELRMRLSSGGMRLFTRIQPLDQLRRVELRPPAYAGGSPILRLHARSGPPLDVKLVGYHREQARWVHRLVEHLRERNAAFWSDELASADSAAIDALVRRAGSTR